MDLPLDIARWIPQEHDLGQVDEVIQLRSGLDGCEGETLMVLKDGALLVFTRASSEEPFSPVTLVAAPKLAEDAWDVFVRLWSADGPHKLEVGDIDLPRVRAVLDGADSEPAPSAATDPDTEIESLRASLNHYRAAGRMDEVWCHCAALVVLKQAEPEEREIFKRYRIDGLPAAKTRIKTDLWHELVFHPDEDRFVGAILATIAPVIGSMTAKRHRQLGLVRKERRDLTTDRLLLSRIFAYVTSVLGSAKAELYLRPEMPIGMLMAHTTELPSFVVGADLLRRRPHQELAFVVARQLSYLRPERFLRKVLTTPSHMRTVFYATLRIVNPELPVPLDHLSDVESIGRHMLEELRPEVLESLTVLGRKFNPDRVAETIDRWWAATDLTADRAGFVLCNDLEVAARMLSKEPVEQGGLAPKERIRELARYGVSEEYFRIRKALGLTIGAEPMRWPGDTLIRPEDEPTRESLSRWMIAVIVAVLLGLAAAVGAYVSC